MGPLVWRELIEEELGVSVTEAELRSLNIALEKRWRSRGEEGGFGAEALVAKSHDEVDFDKVSRLLHEVDNNILEWVARGRYPQEVRETAKAAVLERILASRG